MKPQETKNRFIELRAEGKSFNAITTELGISKSTCSKWEQELEAEIARLKREELTALYNSYHMTKEARIKRLGNTLEQIEEALAGADFTEVSPEKLLDYKLKYTEALRGEYTAPAYKIEAVSPNAIVEALGDLLNRVRDGEVTPEQANRESTVLANLLKAYEAVETKNRIDDIENMIRGV